METAHSTCRGTTQQECLQCLRLPRQWRRDAPQVPASQEAQSCGHESGIFSTAHKLNNLALNPWVPIIDGVIFRCHRRWDSYLDVPLSLLRSQAVLEGDWIMGSG